jgi:branched-subunit amino acid transport protein
MDERLFAIVGMALVTFVPRIVPAMLLPDVKLPRVVVRWLSLIAPAILSALLLPELLLDDSSGVSVIMIPNVFMLAALPALIAARMTKSLCATVVTGMTFVALLRLL